MSKQWVQIVAIWVGVMLAAAYASMELTDEQSYAVFAALAGGSIAVVSLEHLISANAKDTVRQQVYAAAGSFAILGLATILKLLS